MVVPSSMLAAKKRSILPCFTPFTNCVKIDTVTTPQPGAGQVLVQVAGSSVNPCDVDYLEFHIGCGGGQGILGMDVAGTVVQVGDGVTRLKVGDEVWADGGGVKGVSGTMAQFAVLSEAQTALKPKALSMIEAATIPLVGFTALELLTKSGAPWTNRTNVTVVVTSGSGGTGFVLVQLAKKAFSAARVVSAASGAANLALVQKWGADLVVDYHEQEVFDALPDESVDIVIDNIGLKGTADKAMRTLKQGSAYVLLPGGGGGAISKKPKAGVTQINFGYTDASSHAGLDTLAALFDAGKLEPHVYQQYPLANVSAAFAASKTGHVVGKVAVEVPRPTA
eukprot:g6125.t1